MHSAAFGGTGASRGEMISPRFTRVNSRLERLEENNRHERAGVMEQIQKAALQELSDEDLNVMKAFIDRGSPFADRTPEESGMLERYSAACAAAALRITGRPPSRRAQRSCR